MRQLIPGKTRCGSVGALRGCQRVDSSKRVCVSQELNCSYGEMAARGPEPVLGALLSSRRPDRCSRARAFVAAQGIPPDTVAELVAEEILRELLASSGGKGREEASACTAAVLVCEGDTRVSESQSLLPRYSQECMGSSCIMFVNLAHLV